jgi:hypothetical protein
VARPCVELTRRFVREFGGADRLREHRLLSWWLRGRWPLDDGRQEDDRPQNRIDD